MEDWLLLVLLVLGFLIGVPWAAFAALSRARRALALATRQQAEIAALRAAVIALGGNPAVLESAETAPDFGAGWLPAMPPHPIAADEPAPQTASDTALQPAFGLAPVREEAAPNAPANVAMEASMPAQAPPADEVLAEAAREGVAEPAYSYTDAADARFEALPPQDGQPPEPAPAAARRDFEEAIGSRWAVWVGGVALAFGGLFLVRYSIESGVFGPGVRLLMGAAFALVAAAASEYLRRRDVALPAALRHLAGANIPGVLAGVSVLSGFGVVYAAYGLYGFIGPTLAFALMAAIGLAALAASLVHGPVLGLFGLVGSYVTPLLVSSTAPSIASLALFLGFVTTVAFLLPARRPSRVVTLGAVAGHGIWTLLIAFAGHGVLWPAVLLVIAAVLALALLKEWPAWRGRDAEGAWLIAGFDATGLIAIAVPLVLSGVIWVAFGGPAPLHAAILVTVLVAIVAAIRHRDLAPLAPLAAAAAAGMVLLWPSREGSFGITPDLFFDLVRLSFTGNAGPGIAWTAAALALFVGGLPFYALLTRSRAGAGGFITRGCLAFASALGPVCLLLATALRSNGFERSPGFAALALGLTIALFAASEFLLPVERRSTKSRTNPLALIGSAAYAAGGSIALGLAVAFALRETWLVVGLAIAAAGVAIVASLRPIPLLRSMSAALATAALARLIWQPPLSDMGSWPVFNWLIPAYALPALCFAIGALALRGRQDRPRSVHEAMAALFGAAFVLLEVRQFFAGPDLMPSWKLIEDHYFFNARNSLFQEAAAHVAAVGLLGAGFQVLARRLGGRVFGVASDIAAAVLMVLSVGGLGALLNPLFDGTSVTGWPILNRLLLYVLVGGLLGGLGFALSRQGRSRVGEALNACAAVLVPLGVVLIVRHAFAGPQLMPADGYILGFSEAVMITIVLLALTAAARIWHEASDNRVTSFALRGLALLAIAWAALALGLWRNPLLDQSGVSGPVVFNRILWGYGAAALAFAGAAFWMRDARPRISQAFARTATAVALLGAFLLLRHGFHGPMLVSEVPVTLAEAGCYASLGFVAAIFAMVAGSVRLLGRPVSVSAGSAAVASCGAFALFSGGIANPLVTEMPLAGPLILDNALIGYLVPAVLAFTAARWTREHVATPLARRIFGATAIIGGLAYVLIEVRRWFVGPDLLAEAGSAAELYAYSAAILLYGVALLALGFRLQSKDLRLASLGVVTVAICKAFLVDMSGLEGLLRALSFIGLGACLVGIGLAYQRLLQREAAQQDEAARDAPISG
ncbi:DUF2339 domain-containing protein [Bosea caraganae]|uniref:DUF2339 domain-containing protein n=1 Tax=Bosea caraganae TaxID=2763117 RepID=A0A370KXM3_9HYPH|nr:DUF2339 domain-containing protein [Bosea caraganae]RDJ19727.1 DUF2339 domain-containing protein [Bosea caraganae]RDJ21392.1 DUF2339 domain-containing protein [Bosea caraganae]